MKAELPGHMGDRSADATRLLSLDSEARCVHLDGRRLELTVIEFDLLAFLYIRPDQVQARQEIIEGVWGSADFFDRHGLEVHIGRLRRKLGESGRRPHFITTIRGIGYRFNSAGSEEHVASLVYDADLLLTKAWLKDGDVFGEVPTALIGSSWIPIPKATGQRDGGLYRLFAADLFGAGTREARLHIDLQGAPERRVAMRVDLTWFGWDGELAGMGAELFRSDVPRLLV